ncbi:hypothetical protein PIB30_011876 [Stylosanthes scabra]|uniref:Ubiquitin-like protease family profile domain-containing protein n=1 Tax=Stylosanthes scabra TaxID=79078 RepID=A0ABU6U7N3_9FABA|nr:hypothetical protein [Stylosanthes scabra]
MDFSQVVAIAAEAAKGVTSCDDGEAPKSAAASGTLAAPPNTNLELSMEAPAEGKQVSATVPELDPMLVRPLFFSPEEEYIESTKEKVDVESRITNIEQSMAMADYRAARTEIIALDVKHEVRHLVDEVKAMRVEREGFCRGQVAPLFSIAFDVGGNSSAQQTLNGVFETDLGKGKEQVINSVDVGGLFDVVAPNSASDDDVVFLHERKATQPTTLQHILLHPIPSNATGWPFGLPDFGLGLTGMTATGLNNTGQTTQICGAYASGGDTERPLKVPKVEKIEYSTLFNSPLNTLGGLGMAPCMTLSLQANSAAKSAFKPVQKTRKRKAPALPTPCTVIPANYQLLIRPTPDMGLTLEEVMLAAYIFSTSHEYRSKVVNSAALVSSLRSGSSTEVTCWFFASTFAHEILDGKDSSDLIRHYRAGWMPPTSRLNHVNAAHPVFIPVFEAKTSWYLILMDVKDTTVYSLDVSRSTESHLRRERDIRRILSVLAEVFKESPCNADLKPDQKDPNTWGRIQYPLTLPTKLNPEDTAVWCLSWLLNDRRFSPSVSGNMGHELHVRMKAAMVIIGNEYNRIKKLVKMKSDAPWRGFPGHEAFK